MSRFSDLRESGSTERDVVALAPDVWPPSHATIEIAHSEEHSRRRSLLPTAWKAAVRPFLVAALTPVAEVYDYRSKNMFTGSAHVIVIGEGVGVEVYEPESIFAVRRQRPTMWLSSVPMLPRRRPFITPWEPSDSDSE